MTDLAPMQAYRAEQSRKLALALHERRRRFTPFTERHGTNTASANERPMQ